MIEINKQLEYIRSQLAWIKSKVELDNQLGLYDINKLGEDIFMHILNDVYDLNLKNANLIEENFPAIDLIDNIKKIVIQVTSTTTPNKLRSTIEKLKKSTQYSEYKLKIFYIKEKPTFNKDIREEFNNSGVISEDLLGIDDIIDIIQAEPNKCQTLYRTIQQRMDAISFKFNIESYFESFEPHLQNISSDKFKKYEKLFIEFIKSEEKVLDIHSVGGNGKSHLLRYLGLVETEYIPLIFTKQINIEEDLKKLDSTKKYLFIIDDIDRFLDQPILLNLLSYTIDNPNIKLILSYRTPSKNAIQTVYRKYSKVDRQELEIIWNEDEIKSLIADLAPNLEEHKVLKLAHTFNGNPFLITQAISGDIESIKDFSKKIIDDTKVALNDSDLNNNEISDLLFNVSLLTPISKNNIDEKYKERIVRLVDSGVLRELASKYRFNPDMIGDLYLANYIDENQNTFEKIVENNLKEFSDTVFTNLSYALVYNESDSLQNFINNIIGKWRINKKYRNDYLALINKIVYYAPMESFIYLEEATKALDVPIELSENDKENEDRLMQIITHNRNCIKLEDIEPIISKLIYALKNNIPCEKLSIEYILKYLTSTKVLSLPKPYYSNQTLDSIFEKIVSPLNTNNFDVILETFNIMEKWLDDNPVYNKKQQLLFSCVEKLLQSTFSNTSFDGINFSWNNQVLNTQYSKVSDIIKKAKNILLKLLESNNNEIVLKALDIVLKIGNGMLSTTLSEDDSLFYSDLRKEALEKCISVLENNKSFIIQSKIEDIAIWVLKYTFEDTEALSLLDEIERTDEYLFYKVIKGDDVLCLKYDDCNSEYQINKDNYELVWGSQKTKMRKIFESKNDKYEKKQEIIGREERIIDDIATNYTDIQMYLDLLNSLNTTDWNSSSKLMIIFKKWLSSDNTIFLDLALKHFNEIKNPLVTNVLKEALLLEGRREVSIDDISDNTSKDDIKIYMNTLFKNYTDESIDILNKIIDVSQSKEPQYIRWIISLASGGMYFKIREDVKLYKKFEHIIIQFLDWQIEYCFDVESYITYHILHDTIINDNISYGVKNRLEKIVKNDDITISEFELKPIYKILNYGLKECIDILYNKLTSLKENGNPKYIFTHYFNSDNISEVILLKKLISDYDDFSLLVAKVLEYYKSPIEFIGADGNEYEAYINLDYFFKYTITKEYLDELFNGLHNDGGIDAIKLLYKIVPVNSEFLEIIVKNLNKLESTIDEKELINYLNQVGKIKSFSRAHGENSSLLLNEEALFTEIMNRVDSLSLRSKLKEQLKYIELQKREELEKDISRLLDK